MERTHFCHLYMHARRQRPHALGNQERATENRSQGKRGQTHPVLIALEQPVHVVRLSARRVVRARDVQELAPDLGEEPAIGDLERPGVAVRGLVRHDFVRLALGGE